MKLFNEKIAAKKAELEAADGGNKGDDTNDMAVINADYERNKAEVITMLIKNVMTVNKDIPRVVRGNFEEED